MDILQHYPPPPSSPYKHTTAESAYYTTKSFLVQLSVFSCLNPTRLCPLKHLILPTQLTLNPGLDASSIRAVKQPVKVSLAARRQ